MSDLVFPSDLPGIRLQCERMPIYKTGVMEAVSGQEYRAAWASRPRNRWRLTIEFLRSATPLEWQQMVSFYQRHGGQWDSFLFTDPDDHTIGEDGMLFGIGDGAETEFQIQRTLLPEERVTGNIWFSYAPGDDYAALGGVFARAGAATYVNEQGVLATALTGVLRDNHWIIPTGQTERVRTTLLEPARENLLTRSQEFDDAAWTAVACIVTANATTAPDGTATADLLTANSSTSGAVIQSITFTANGEKCVALYMKGGTSGRSRINIQDTTAGIDRHGVNVTWTAGVPSLSTALGAGTLYPVEVLADDWYRILFSATGIVAANANRIVISPDNLVGTGTVYAWGAQAENASVASSYIPTAAATVTRSADSLYFDFGVVPQAMTAYARFVEQSSPNWELAAARSPRVAQVGNNVDTGSRWIPFYKPSASAVYRAQHFNAAAASGTSNATATPVLGDLVELNSVLASDGSVRLDFAKNQGTVTLGTASGAVAMDGSFAAAELHVGSLGAAGGGSIALSCLVVALGEQTMETMREYAAADASPVQFWPSMRDGYEPITEFNGAPEIYLAGILQVEGTDYTIDDEGVVTFTAPPALPVPIRWFGSYYKRARFATDLLASQRLFTGMWEQRQVDLIQVI